MPTSHFLGFSHLFSKKYIQTSLYFHTFPKQKWSFKIFFRIFRKLRGSSSVNIFFVRNFLFFFGRFIMYNIPNSHFNPFFQPKSLVIQFNLHKPIFWNFLLFGSQKNWIEQIDFVCRGQKCYFLANVFDSFFLVFKSLKRLGIWEIWSGKGFGGTICKHLFSHICPLFNIFPFFPPIFDQIFHQILKTNCEKKQKFGLKNLV